MDDHARQLGQGFNWLGGATVVARIVDFLTILTMLWFLTKQQVGVASLVISVGMIVEAFNGLGTSEALIQARSVVRLQLDSLFWYIIGAATVMSGLTLLAAPWIEAIYGNTGMTTYFFAIAVKQPLVGAALIPLAIMNRDLQYERIAVVNVCATMAAALTRLGLGAAGAGTWALVAGYSASGFYILVGAMLARPFRPNLRFRLAAILPLMRFGIRAAIANMTEQTFKNIDYLLIGWFYGPSRLAIYRVAFDVAMEPAMAVGTLVNRTALPVLARVSAAGGDIAPIVTWSLRKIATLVVPLAMALILAADPLTRLLHDEKGHDYSAAAIPLEILAAAALLRAMSQLMSTVILGSGRPGTAAMQSAMTLLLLGAGILTVGFTLHGEIGIIAVSAIWLGIYPILLIWGIQYLRRRFRVRFGDLAQTLIIPFIGSAVLVSIVEMTRRLISSHDPLLQIAIVLTATMLTYAGLFLSQRHRPHQEA